MDRRKFFNIAGAAAAAPALSFAWQARTASRPSLSRQLARFAAGLRYEDLPPAVVDRARGLTLQYLASVLVGSQLPGGKEAVKFIAEDEAVARNGATIMVNGAKV